MTRPSIDDLLGRMARRGLPDADTATRALRATLVVLGERLVDDEARALAASLPAELAPLVENAGYDSDFAAAELYERVRRREPAGAARAKEHAEIVVAVLGEVMEPDRRARVARALPAEVADLLVPRADVGSAEPPPYGAPQSTQRSATLAAGRPGSAHPVSEAAPPSGQAHSVASNPDPHADTKLSTSQGLTQERLHETLADAQRK